MVTEINIKFDAANLRLVQLGLVALQLPALTVQAQACEAWLNAQIHAAVGAAKEAPPADPAAPSRSIPPQANGSAPSRLGECHTDPP